MRSLLADTDLTSSDSEATRIINLFLLAWTLSVSYPLFVFSWYQFITHHKERYFQQRGLRLILFQLIIMTVHNCIVSPLKLVYDDLHWISMSPVIGAIIKYFFDRILYLALFSALCLRVWIVNYANQLQLERSTAACEQQFGDAFRVDETSFYIRYRRTLGSLSFMSCVLTVAYVSYLCIDFLMTVVLNVPQTATVIMSTATFVIWPVIMALLWYKFPKFTDNLYLRDELKHSVLYMAAILLFGVVLWVLAHYVSSAVEALVQWPLILFVDGLCYIGIWRVISKNKRREKATIQLADYVQLVRLRHILEHKNAYIELMNFLAKEFASENLCFVTEYLLFRDSLNFSAKEKIALRCNVDLHVPESHVKSAFWVQNVAVLDPQQFIATASALYNKYIAAAVAPYEINISSYARSDLAALIDPKYNNGGADLPDHVAECMQAVIPVFEVILNEIVVLLGRSVERFKYTPDGENVCNAITRKATKKKRTWALTPDPSATDRDDSKGPTDSAPHSLQLSVVSHSETPSIDSTR